VVHERSGRWVQSAAGGDDHYSGDLMETFTWAGAVAAVTERIGIISTVHVTVNHPVRREGLGDGRSDLDGRAGMNLVLGWYPADMQLFGYELKEHKRSFLTRRRMDAHSRSPVVGAKKSRLQRRELQT
jgi:FMNH2-dependent dimethyl sulfone monooxygenase